MKRVVYAGFLLTVCLVLVIAVPAFAQGTGTSSQSSTTGGANTSGSGAIVVSAQDVPFNQVVVQSVNAPADGWLLIRKDVQGQPGGVIGYAPVHAGLNQGLRVDLRIQSSSSSRQGANANNITSVLWAELVSDPNASNPLTSPSASAESAAPVAMVAFATSLSANNGATTGTVPTTGGANTSASRAIVVKAQDLVTTLGNQVVIQSVNAPAAGWVLVRKSMGGAPGPVIGWAPVNAGLNQDVRVDIQLQRQHFTALGQNTTDATSRDNITPVLWVTLVTDPNALNPFASPSTDVQNQAPVATATFATSLSSSQAGNTTPTTGGVSSSNTQGSPSAQSNVSSTYGAAACTNTGTGQSSATAGNTPTTGGANSSSSNLIQARAQDIAGNQVVIGQVTSPVIGWLLIEKDAGGRPGNVIGWASLNCGVNQNVRVDLQLTRQRGNGQGPNAPSATTINNITPVLWAAIVPDVLAAQPFTVPSPEVQSQAPVAVAAFSSTANGGVGFGSNTGSGSGGTTP